MAKPLTSWLVSSFSQHNLCLVVLGRCLHVSVTKFQDKFASLQQVNSPNSWNKFQICCTDIYLIRFLPNFAVFCVFLWISQDFTDLPEFRGSATAWNIRSPDYTVYMYMYISTISVHLQLSLAKFETGWKKVAFKLVFWARSSHLPSTLLAFLKGTLSRLCAHASIICFFFKRQ